MRNLEALDGEEACLKACSLVCKEWSLPARRMCVAVLFLPLSWLIGLTDCSK